MKGAFYYALKSEYRAVSPLTARATVLAFESKKLLHIFHLLVYDWVGGVFMINKNEVLEARDELFKLFAQKIKEIFSNDNFIYDYNENRRDTINFHENHSEFHVNLGQRNNIIIIINHWEKDAKSIDIVYQDDGKWMIEPSEDNWTEFNKAIEVDEHLIEKILNEFKTIANATKESRAE